MTMGVRNRAGELSRRMPNLVNVDRVWDTARPGTSSRQVRFDPRLEAAGERVQRALGETMSEAVHNVRGEAGDALGSIYDAARALARK